MTKVWNIQGVEMITPRAYYPDKRGIFMEYYNIDNETHGFADGVLQISFVRSHAGVLRGLHFQHTPPMSKLFRVISGSIEVVIVDLRHDSPTAYCHIRSTMNPDDASMLKVPAGMALGYYTYVETTVEYFHSETHRPDTAMTIAWNDPDLAIEWPDTNPILSAKDEHGLSLNEWRELPLASQSPFIYR